MNTVELKNILIHRISEINDVSFLNAIKTILDSKAINEMMPLSNEQKEEIKASKKDIEEGLYMEHDEFGKEIKAWLKEK